MLFSDGTATGIEGYYARWAALRKLLLQFLKSERKTNDKNQTEKQILSLGAGFDTTYFQLLDEGIAPYLYVELDFKEVRYFVHLQYFVDNRAHLTFVIMHQVTSKKAAIIDHYGQLRDKIGPEASISIGKLPVVSS
ncbi:hypothetical protein GW17_00041798 [Ensete ventricosum]|uniref:Uncharacterized protein n=1 Tax=Ensete ventricosum TaxID=4639 RepID=A0A444DBU5_ENSVE|nr:hypothetical protein B296_00001355 [Ensete ventricosum]RWV95577.1 hypothetical protein GW17_00041798 [Ensete ventricosum]RZR93318.1 hypothetical protein BHM03_00021785 [Ensete ventricosum]